MTYDQLPPDAPIRVISSRLYRQPQKKWVDIISEYFIKEQPKLWHRVYTKHVNASGSYRSLKAVAAVTCCGIMECDWESRYNGFVPSNVPLIEKELSKYHHPVYYVCKEILEAIKNTKPPNKTWDEIKFPLPAITFMLPTWSGIREPVAPGDRFSNEVQKGGEIFSLTIARLEPGPDRVWIGDDKHTPKIVVSWMPEPAGFISQDCTFPVTQRLAPDANWIAEATKTSDQILGKYRQKLVEPPPDFSAKMAGFAANLVLLMQSKPEYVELGSRLPKSLGNGTPTYSPNFIGRKYKTRFEGRKDPTGAHYTEIGWRSGSWRDQHYGPGNKEVKEIWVEPYMAHIRGLVRPDENSSEKCGDSGEFER